MQPLDAYSIHITHGDTITTYSNYLAADYMEGKEHADGDAGDGGGSGSYYSCVCVRDAVSLNLQSTLPCQLAGCSHTVISVRTAYLNIHAGVLAFIYNYPMYLTCSASLLGSAATGASSARSGSLQLPITAALRVYILRR